MMDRRYLLASVASLLGLLTFRWLRAEPAKAAEKFEVEKTDAEWRAQLTPQQYEILRKHGTERPWSSPLLKEHRKGIFACAGCDRPYRGPFLRHDSDRGALPPLRRPYGPCLRRRSETHRSALLHRWIWPRL